MATREEKEERDAEIAHLIAEEGWSYREIAAVFDLSYGHVGVIARQWGVASGRGHEEPSERNLQIAERYRNDETATMQSLADEWGITRERVRQIVRKYGVTPEERGRPQRQKARIERLERLAAERREQKRKKIEQRHDMSLEEYEAIALSERNMRFYRRPRIAYLSFRHNRLVRGAEFELPFGAWWRIWQASGHWAQRGRGKYRYVMTRIDHRLPYREDNVMVTTQQEASRHFWKQVARGEIPDPSITPSYSQSRHKRETA